MAQYNNIYDILKQFENQVVKGNHYTKTQANATFVKNVNELSQLITLLKSENSGVIAKSADSTGSAPSLTLDNTFAHESYVNNKVTEEIGKIVKGAPELLDTLAEVSKALNDDPNFYQTMKNMIDKKADKTELNNYQTKSNLLTNLLAQLGSTNTGLVKVTHDSTGSTNVVSIDTTQYAKASDLTPYATQTWVNSQGFLKSHQDISGKADKTWVTNNFQHQSPILSKILTVAGGATTGLIKVSATGSSEGNVIGIETDYVKSATLNSYATKTELSAYAKTSALSAYAKTTDLAAYQKTDAMLTNLIATVKGNKSGLVKVTTSSSGNNVVGIDQTAYATAANLTITDEQLATLIDK